MVTVTCNGMMLWNTGDAVHASPFLEVDGVVTLDNGKGDVHQLVIGPDHLWPPGPQLSRHQGNGLQCLLED